MATEDQLARACADELLELAEIFETIARRLVQLADGPTVACANMLLVSEQSARLARSLRSLATLAPPREAPAE